jgi:hypothetical protein
VPELAPEGAEPLVEKHYGDAFEDTRLEPVLSGLGVGRLVVAGAQTAPGRTAGTVPAEDVEFSAAGDRRTLPA